MDDLSNNWGVNLCLPERYHRSLGSSSLPMRAKANAERSSSATLPVLLAAETDQFVFERVSSCGSQANSWAIDDATNLNKTLCLFAAGSYVAGDASALQSYSTSEFNVNEELSLVVPPQEVAFPQARANTIPLPFHIPGVISTKELNKYEDKCFQAVHIKLSWAKMRGKPYKAILLELMLAGNGAILSNRALVALGKLAVYHNLCVIVDEIMTGGRTGAMFYLLSKPVSFINVVTHITFGKWTQMGMIFLSKPWAKKRPSLYPFTKRGASTFLCPEDAVSRWRCLKKTLSEIPNKKEKVLKKLRLSNKQVWGEGLLLFGSHRRETAKGLKCRYLPLAHEHTPIDNVKYTQLMNPHSYRIHVNNAVMGSVNKWVQDEPVAKSHARSTPEEWKQDKEELSDFCFISKLIKESTDGEEKPSDSWKDDCMPIDSNRKDGESALSRLKLAGLMEKTQSGKKRKRQWKLKPGLIAPWKSTDLDEIIHDMFD